MKVNRNNAVNNNSSANSTKKTETKKQEPLFNNYNVGNSNTTVSNKPAGGPAGDGIIAKIKKFFDNLLSDKNVNTFSKGVQKAGDACAPDPAKCSPSLGGGKSGFDKLVDTVSSWFK